MAGGCTKGCLVVVLGFIGLCALGTIAQQMKSPEERAKDAAAQEELHTEVGAHSAAEAFVTESLKSPASAKFPSIVHWSITRSKKDKAEWLVSSYVDSQNSFGADLRTTFVVILRHKGGDPRDRSNWEILSFKHAP